MIFYVLTDLFYFPVDNHALFLIDCCHAVIRVCRWRCHIWKYILNPIHFFWIRNVRNINGNKVGITIGIQNIVLHRNVNIAGDFDEFQILRAARIPVVNNVDTFQFLIYKDVTIFKINLSGFSKSVAAVVLTALRKSSNDK